MALGLKGRLAACERNLRRGQRHHDIACQFVVQELDAVGEKVWTGRESPVYGGRWDVRAREYVGDAEDVLYDPVTNKQLDFILSDAEVVEGSGGRSGGKSEAGVRKIVRKVCELPRERGRVVTPGPDQKREMWEKLLDFFLEQTDWLKPGLLGIKESLAELHFWNGHILQIISAHKPRKLRGWGCSYASLDEAQLIPTVAVDILTPCLRRGKHPQLFMQLTPEAGDALERHLQYEKDPLVAKIHFDSYSNIFVPRAATDMSLRRMSKDMAAVEIGADWETVKRMAAAHLRPVFPVFSEDKHGIRWPVLAKDITKEVTKLRTGYGRKFICGIDPNWDAGNFAVLYKVLEPLPDEHANRWVAVDVVTSKGHCGQLAKEIVAAGYNARDVLVVPDSSDRWKEKSARFLRQAGFAVVALSRNPHVLASIDDIRAKLDPAVGQPSWFYNIETCQALAYSMENAIWNKSGERIDKSADLDHVIDAARYPISYFDPAAPVRRGVVGYAAK